MYGKWIGISIIGLWLILGLIARNKEWQLKAIISELAGIGIILFDSV